MATKVNDNTTVREVSTHLDLEESLNRGLTNINELNGRQLALINHELKDWRTIIS